MEKKFLPARCGRLRHLPNNKERVLCGGTRTEIIISNGRIVVCSECDAPTPVEVAH